MFNYHYESNPIGSTTQARRKRHQEDFNLEVEEPGFCCCLSRCFVVICHCKCNETTLPITIGPVKRALADFRDDMQHQYTRFTQASLLIVYWPIVAGFVLGVLGIFQVIASSNSNSFIIVKRFGATQAIIGLVSTLSVGYGYQIKNRAEFQLRACIDEGIKRGFFKQQEESSILRKLGLSSSTEEQGNGGDLPLNEFTNQQRSPQQRPTTERINSPLARSLSQSRNNSPAKPTSIPPQEEEHQSNFEVEQEEEEEENNSTFHQQEDDHIEYDPPSSYPPNPARGVHTLNVPNSNSGKNQAHMAWNAL